MRRIDRIRSMSVTELADALMDTGMDGYIDFYPSSNECTDYMEEHGEVTMEMCKSCLIKWLMEEA